MTHRMLYMLMVLLAVGAVVSAVLVFPFMPEQVASHWSVSGEVDGYMSKTWGTFLLPGILLVLVGIFTVLPYIDPFKKNISESRTAYDFILLSPIAFLTYLHGLSLAWNLGAEFDFIGFLAPALGVLCIGIGWMLPYTKRNWFLGIRTPWTLSSDFVWERTHKAGKTMFVGLGLIVGVVGISSPERAFWVVIILGIFSVIWSFVYSYYVYKKSL